MKESRKQFIKEAHKNACSQWRTKIEKEFPKLFPKAVELENGKWYKSINNSAIIYIVSRNHSTNAQKWYDIYGFDKYGQWIKGSGQLFDNGSYTLATDEEVEEALFKEAKKKGFKEGVNVGNFNRFGKELVLSEGYHYNARCGMFFMGDTCIFKNGQWAEIVSQPKEMTVAEVSKELGYEVKIIER